MRHPQLQDGGVGKRLPDVLVGNPGGDHPQRTVPPLDPVAGKRFRELRKRPHPLFHENVARPGVLGEHDPLGRVADETGGERRPGHLSEPDRSLGVGDAGRRPQENGSVELLRQREGDPRELLCLLRVGGLEHGDLGRHRVMPVVLLVLGGVHFRVVRGDDDEPAPHAGVGRGEDRVRRHVDAHVLHGRKRPRAGHRGPEGDLHRHLFVGGPLRVHPLVPGEVLQDLRARRPGIGGGDLDPRFEGTAGDGLVSGQKFDELSCRYGQRFPLLSPWNIRKLS